MVQRLRFAIIRQMGLSWQGWGLFPSISTDFLGILGENPEGFQARRICQFKGEKKLWFSNFKVVKIQILRFLIFYDGGIWDSKIFKSITL